MQRMASAPLESECVVPVEIVKAFKLRRQVKELIMPYKGNCATGNMDDNQEAFRWPTTSYKLTSSSTCGW